jgi:hypothetical protein
VCIQIEKEGTVVTTGVKTKFALTDWLANTANATQVQLVE